jgi:L-serine dehydratase
MEAISVFDIFKIGIGPSSSHTMGPWRAAEQFVRWLREQPGAGKDLAGVRAVSVDLYGSLAKTGKGHGTDFAVLMGLAGEDPVTCDVEGVQQLFASIVQGKVLCLGGTRELPFDASFDVRFRMREALPFHANALTLHAELASGSTLSQTYYSVGGGFVVQEDVLPNASQRVRLPNPIEKARELEDACERTGLDIAGVVLLNERTWRTDHKTRDGLLRIWQAMRECIFRGCHTGGELPGGLRVTRRAAAMNHKLLGIAGPVGKVPPGAQPLGETVARLTTQSLDVWCRGVRASGGDFQNIMKWVGCFALAVNEENAAFGRVVTAPTNGAAGVIPAVMMYMDLFAHRPGTRTRDEAILDFMLVAGELGSLFKKGATISAAMGGCQAEIGVSSAMAAGGLAYCLGANTQQVLMAAEIAMEHHLGMTCDPIGGLVQVPCIERNTMGAIKAIMAANIAMESDASQAKVHLDDVIATMWATAKDMHTKYKETAEGGLALRISVSVSEC